MIPSLAGMWRKDNELATAGMARTSTIEEEVGNVDAFASVHIDEQLISSLLKAHRLESLSFTTALRWMRLLNFKNDTRKNSFYVESHECDYYVVETRNEFCKR